MVVLVPRQCGKTTFVFDLALGRCLGYPDYRAAYAAQTGHVTTERFGDRFLDLDSTPLADRFGTRRSQGTERFRGPRGSYLKAFPPKDGALRSSALDLVVVDESQEHGEQLGRALDQTIIPTFTTRPRRQLWLVGTAGTTRSAYLARYRDMALAGEPGVGLIEYGADPEADDLLAEDTWRRTHPGLGILTDLDAMRGALAAMGEAAFIREYLNIWTDAADRVIPSTEWAACATDDPIPDEAEIVFAADLAYDRSSAAILAVGGDVAEVIESRPGVDWAAGRAGEMADRWAAPILVDPRGPSASLADQLHDHKRLQTLAALDVTAAANLAYDDIRARTFAYRRHPDLDAAAAAAGRRRVGESWVWSRRDSQTSIAPLIAASNAWWGRRHRPARRPSPMIEAG